MPKSFVQNFSNNNFAENIFSKKLGYKNYAQKLCI